MFKALLRNLLINGFALYAATLIIPGFSFSGGFKTLFLGAMIFMVINIAIVPLLKILLLPLNLLTFGIFAWVVNVIALYLLTVVLPQFRILPYEFLGLNIFGIIIPKVALNTLHVAVITSLIIGFISHFLQWLRK